VSIVVIIMVIAIISPVIYVYYTKPHNEQWREVAQLLDEKLESGDSIVVYQDWYIEPIKYYKKDNLNVVRSKDIDQIDGARIWLILAYDIGDSMRSKLLARSYSLILQEKLYGVSVYLFGMSGVK
jgi:hypothetical protein